MKRKKHLVRIISILICAIFVLAVIIPLILYIVDPHSTPSQPVYSTVTLVSANTVINKTEII